MANRRLFAKFEVRSGRADRHSSNVVELRGDQMSPRNVGSQINISRCYTRIDKLYTLYEEDIQILLLIVFK